MTQLEALELFEDVRADYVATLRDLHGLRKLIKPFQPIELLLVQRLDKAIKDLQGAFPNRRGNAR